MPDDKFIAESEKAELDAHRSARAANLFDVRRFIGGLFVIYGVILLVLGLGASDADVDKAAGVNVNLWTGLAMLLVGAFFLAWAFTRPLSQQLEEDEGPTEPPEGDRPVTGDAAPAGAETATPGGSDTAGRRPGSDPGSP